MEWKKNTFFAFLNFTNFSLLHFDRKAKEEETKHTKKKKKAVGEFLAALVQANLKNSPQHLIKHTCTSCGKVHYFVVTCVFVRNPIEWMCVHKGKEIQWIFLWIWKTKCSYCKRNERKKKKDLCILPCFIFFANAKNVCSNASSSTQKKQQKENNMETVSLSGVCEQT